MKKIFAIGEALIDFIPSQKGCALKEVVSFERVAGGAPANVCGAIAKLGGNASFISQLGEDAFGEFIIDELKAVNVDTSHVLTTKQANTGLAFVSLKEDGNRDFSFYRNPSADLLLNENQIEEAWFKGCYGLHFCSVDLVESPMKYAHQKAIEYVLNEGGVISFDPNVRLPLWPTSEACQKAILEFLPLAHVIKISDEELEFITGMTDINIAKEQLFTGNVEMIIYTKGGEGAEIFTKTKHVQIPGNVMNVMDTTGAGDSFIGAFLYKLGKDDVSAAAFKELNEETLEEYLSFANDYAGYSTQGKGAIASYATLEQLEGFRKNK